MNRLAKHRMKKSSVKMSARKICVPSTPRNTPVNFTSLNHR
jgi:hypothetical protein